MANKAKFQSRQYQDRRYDVEEDCPKYLEGGISRNIDPINFLEYSGDPRAEPTATSGKR